MLGILAVISRLKNSAEKLKGNWYAGDILQRKEFVKENTWMLMKKIRLDQIHERKVIHNKASNQQNSPASCNQICQKDEHPKV